MTGRPRVHLVLDPAAELAPTVAVARWLAPEASAVHVVALQPPDRPAGREGLAEDLEPIERALAGWSAPPAAPGALPATVALGFEATATGEEARLGEALVVVGPTRNRSARERVRLLLDLSERGADRLVSVGSGVAGVGEGGAVALVFEHLAGMAAVAAAALELPRLERAVAFVPGGDEALAAAGRGALPALLGGRPVEVVVVPWSPLGLARLVEQAASREGVDLIVVARGAASRIPAVVGGLIAGRTLLEAPRPILVVPSAEAATRLHASDALRVPGTAAPIALERSGTFGRQALGPDERLVRLAGPGVEAEATLAIEGNCAALPPAWLSPRKEAGPEAGAADPALLLALASQPGAATTCRLVDGRRPLALVDALVDPAAVAALRAAAEGLPPAPGGDLLQPVFVRLRPDDALVDLRARLPPGRPDEPGPALIDASAWLDDGGGADLPRAVDGQRLLRLGLRLATRGARVVAVVAAGDPPLSCPSLAALSDAQLLGRAAPRPAPLAPAPDPYARLDAAWRAVIAAAPDAAGDEGAVAPGALDEAALDHLTSSRAVDGSRVELELDNREARAALLAAFAEAAVRIHLQAYIFEEGPAIDELCQALAAAGARGVRVRVLADALYSRHEAFGVQNPVLRRLALCPGVEVRAGRPLSGVPSLADLKQRNHRKLITVDGAHGWVSGRNLGPAYYTGFDEVRLGPASDQREVPWLDASARLAGPLVAALDAAFSADWVAAGGEAPGLLPPPMTPREGPPRRCRLVLHQGLADGHTLDAQRHLVERARERLVVVNTFPLALELQRALIAACRRGVRVQVLFGNVLPRWGERRPFTGGRYRELGDELVRSRLDPVLRAGAEGYEAALTPRPGWDPALERVWIQVHAKLLVRDLEDVAVGSANLDVTSAYWESEALLVVHDGHFARQALDRLEPLLASATRVDPDDEAWAGRRAGRAFLGQHWPSLIG